MKLHWIVVVVLFVLTGCGKNIPDDIIQPAQMENVLYDYHLTIGMSINMKNTEKEAMKNYLFQKHRISSADFDSSMVWYTRNTSVLAEIYENLDKRFKREHKHIEKLLESRDESDRFSLPGDTVNIWNKSDLFWLNQYPLNNQMAFDIKADTTFHPRDSFVWKMDIRFLTEGEASIGYNVIYKNDSVIGISKQITRSGSQSISIYSDSAYQIKSLNGFIYITSDSNQQANALINHVSLTRYHRTGNDSITVEKDSLETPQEKPNRLLKRKPLSR